MYFNLINKLFYISEKRQQIGDIQLLYFIVFVYLNEETGKCHQKWQQRRILLLLSHLGFGEKDVVSTA